MNDTEELVLSIFVGISTFVGCHLYLPLGIGFGFGTIAWMLLLHGKYQR